MENLFEYLISKKNKHRISVSYAKSMLTSGDIIEFADGDFMIYVTSRDISSMKNVPILNGEVVNHLLEEGVFIQYNTHSRSRFYWMDVSKYDDNLAYNKSTNSIGLFIKNIYPNKDKNLLNGYSFSNLSNEGLESLSAERKKITQLPWRIYSNT